MSLVVSVKVLLAPFLVYEELNIAQIVADSAAEYVKRL